MTTELIKTASPRLPRPDRYAAHLDRVLGEYAEIERRHQSRLRRTRWVAVVALAAIGIALLAAMTGCATIRPDTPVYPLRAPDIGATDSYTRPTP